jgi:hypothetical protein
VFDYPPQFQLSTTHLTTNVDRRSGPRSREEGRRPRLVEGPWPAARRETFHGAASN